MERRSTPADYEKTLKMGFFCEPPPPDYLPLLFSNLCPAEQDTSEEETTLNRKNWFFSRGSFFSRRVYSPFF